MKTVVCVFFGVLTGVILGYLWGTSAGADMAIREDGMLSILTIDVYREHYSIKYALSCGVLGGVVGFIIAWVKGER